MDEFEAVLNDAERAMRRGVTRGVRNSCRALLSDSRDRVPYDQGDLSRSGSVSVETGGDVIQGQVAFDTPYAAIQHEAEDFQHQDGQTANYLGGPLRENEQKYMAYIEGEIAKELGG